MAKSIKVLRPGQDVSAKAFRYVTPSAAKHLVACALDGRRAAFWVVVGKILSLGDIGLFTRCLSDLDPSVRRAEQLKALLLSPMPPREVPGCFFRPPPSERNLIGFLAAQRMGELSHLSETA